MSDPRFEWDAFVSHASEDKASFVVPLVDELRKYGLQIWFDAFTLRVGDSLRESIDRGLAKSRFGIVVLSESFFAKNWPQKELHGLFAREVEGRKVILPVWHGITKDDLLRRSPLLADLLACKSSEGIPAVAQCLVHVIRPEAFEIETGVSDAMRSTAWLRQQLLERNPNPHLEIRIIDTGRAEPPGTAPNEQGLIASVTHDGLRIDYIAKDRAAYERSPVSFTTKFSAEAWDQIEQAKRTGGKVRLGPAQIHGVSREFFSSFCFPPGMFTQVHSVEFDPTRALRQQRFRWRLRFECGEESEEFPFVEFETVRRGSELIELRSIAPPLPISLSLSLRPSSVPPIRMTGTFSYDGHEIRKIYKVQHAMRILASGGKVPVTRAAGARPGGGREA